MTPAKKADKPIFPGNRSLSGKAPAPRNVSYRRLPSRSGPSAPAPVADVRPCYDVPGCPFLPTFLIAAGACEATFMIVSFKPIQLAGQLVKIKEVIGNFKSTSES